MKKLVSVFIVLCLALLPVLSLADYAAMSDDELQTELNLIRAEITKRAETKEAKEILAESDGITVTLKGDPAFEDGVGGSKKLTLSVTAVNSSDEAVGIRTDEVYINGWKIGTLFSVTLDPGMKKKDEIVFYKVDEEAELEKLEDLEDIKFVFLTFEPNGYKTKTRDIEKTVSFK